jgi:hypothetical protein
VFGGGSVPCATRPSRRSGPRRVHPPPDPLAAEPASLWAESAARVRRNDGVLVVGDSTLDKPYARSIAQVARHWSGKYHAVVRGINGRPGRGDGIRPRTRSRYWSGVSGRHPAPGVGQTGTGRPTASRRFIALNLRAGSGSSTTPTAAEGRRDNRRMLFDEESNNFICDELLV